MRSVFLRHNAGQLTAGAHDGASLSSNISAATGAITQGLGLRILVGAALRGRRAFTAADAAGDMTGGISQVTATPNVVFLGSMEHGAGRHPLSGTSTGLGHKHDLAAAFIFANVNHHVVHEAVAECTPHLEGDEDFAVIGEIERHHFANGFSTDQDQIARLKPHGGMIFNVEYGWFFTIDTGLIAIRRHQKRAETNKTQQEPLIFADDHNFTSLLGKQGVGVRHHTFLTSNQGHDV